jgi:hypothetical protein
MATYGGGELGGLSGLSALLSNWRQRRVQGRNVVCGEAALEGAAGIVGRAKLGAERGAQRGGEAERGKGRVFAGGAQAAAVADAGGEGHGQEAPRNTLCSRQRGSLASWACGGGRCEGGGAKGSAARGRQAPGTARAGSAGGPTCTARRWSDYSSSYSYRDRHTGTRGESPPRWWGCVVRGGSSSSGARARAWAWQLRTSPSSRWDGMALSARQRAAEREARCDLCAGGND